MRHIREVSLSNTYGYARCSTDEKRQDIDRQRQALLRAGVPEDKFIYWEYDSGTVRDRPELQKLLSVVQPGDTIITTEVSRLTRSTMQLCEFLEFVDQSRLRLVIGTLEIDCREGDTDPIVKGMLLMLGIFAEMERDIISQRIKTGLATARSKGKVLGRPKLRIADLPAKFLKYYPVYQQGELTKTELAALSGVSRMSIYRYIKLIESNIGNR